MRKAQQKRRESWGSATNRTYRATSLEPSGWISCFAAQAVARHDLLCYINCDILLMGDFCAALKRVREKHSTFLMVGRRWDTEITAPLSFGNKDWESLLLWRVSRNGRRRGPEWIDYFVFSRGLHDDGVPPFVVGRVFWDNWLVWKAVASKHAVIDASARVVAVHQNHDYGYHPQGKQGVFFGAEAGGITRWREAGGICGRLQMPRKSWVRTG